MTNATGTTYRNFETHGHEARDTAEEFDEEIKGLDSASSDLPASEMASWAGQPHIKGSSEAMRMALLTFSLVGLQ
jgi:hypothetical protein